MAFRKTKPTSPARRFATYQTRDEVSKGKPHKSLTKGASKSGGRNVHGRVTSRQIVQQYLLRIALYEHKLHAAITVNPKALELADERDRERAQGQIRGPLHGIPIALKDNVQTTFMRTTGGALAFENLVPPYDATLTKNLVDAGAIIIAKTGMSELANWVAGAPTPMPAEPCCWPNARAASSLPRGCARVKPLWRVPRR